MSFPRRSPDHAIIGTDDRTPVGARWPTGCSGSPDPQRQSAAIASREMPIRIEAETLHHALARLEEWDREAAIDARSSLSWLGWDDEGPLLLRRYDLQLHLWYELPTKVSASLER